MRPALLRSISSCVEPALCKGRGRDPTGALEAVPPQRSSLHPQERPSVPAGFRVSKRVAYEKQKASERLTERRGQLLTAPPKRQLALFGNWLLHKQDAGGVGVGAVTVGTSAPQSGNARAAQSISLTKGEEQGKQGLVPQIDQLPANGARKTAGFSFQWLSALCLSKARVRYQLKNK